MIKFLKRFFLIESYEEEAAHIEEHYLRTDRSGIPPAGWKNINGRAYRTTCCGDIIPRKSD